MARKFPEYEQFLAYAKTLGSMDLTIKTHNNDSYASQDTVLKDVFGHSWTTGGYTGGSSCFDDGCGSHCAASGCEGEQEPEWDTLNAVLKKFCPTLSFIKYNAMMKLAHFGQQIENECYGGGHIHAHRYIEAKVLYDWLKDKAA